MRWQHTVKTSVQAKGVGIHSGETVFLAIHPAPEDTGVVFRRTDLDVVIEIPARSDYVVDTQLCTVLAKGDIRIGTVEHVLSAIAGLGIDNAYIDISGNEVPIMDGSAAPFIFLMQSAGIAKQSAHRKRLCVKQEVRVEEGDKYASIAPHDGCQYAFAIDYAHPVVSKFPQQVSIDLTNTSYINEISRARTFGFLEDYEKLKSMNLARGGSLDNAIVIDKDCILNKGGLRYPDELARHKILDAIGDLYLIGHEIIGAFAGYKSGHTLNYRLVRALLEKPEAWEIVSH